MVGKLVGQLYKISINVATVYDIAWNLEKNE
jgi:hypothetical protein